MAFSRSVENLIASLRGLPGNKAPFSRARPTKDIGLILSKTLKKFNLEAQPIETTLAKNWKSLLGEHLAHRANPDGLLQDGRLVIHVGSAAVRTELKFQEATLLKKIQVLEGGKAVKGFLFRL